jgi:glyoxylase-like metal-dependent hydrolase (beta-lactamase superfamily II)
MEMRVASEVHSYKSGDMTVTVLSDGYRMADVAGFVTNAPVEQVTAALAAAGMPTDKLKNSYAPVMIETAGKRVLFDVGNGEEAFIESKGERGRLNHNLAAAGIDRKSIDLVVITHCHADHVNGLLMADGSRAFPNAEIAMSETEWNFWMDDAEMARAPKGRMEGLFKNNRRVFDALGRKVTRHAWDSEVAPGIVAVGTPGHSIGHTSYLCTSGANRLFVQADVCNHAVVFAQNPDWQGWFDQEPVQAVATRRQVYDMLSAEKIPVQAFHFPFPAHGLIEKKGEGYKFVPAA